MDVQYFLIAILFYCAAQASGNSPPQFTAPPILVIREDRPIGYVVGTLRATDSDGDSLTFSVSASGSSFNLVSVSNTPGNAEANITLKSQLNYETVTQFDVGFTVSDGVNRLTRTVTVYVVNVNDNAPLFSKVRYIADVLESTPVGTKILRVEATDPDYGPPTYYFYLKDSDSISQDVSHFRMNQTNGDITLIASLDFEKDAQHILMVMARDQYGWNSTSTVYIRVGDVPDTPLTTTPQANTNSPPQFTAPSILVIKEDLPIGFVVGTLSATDSDGDSLSFSISASGSSFNLVQVSNTPGNAEVNITLRSQLDYETVTQFDVGFTVSDGVNTLTRTVTVYVVNVNDNVPLFNKARYIADVLESAPVGTQILRVEATDPDYGPPTYYFYLKDSDSISQNVSNFRIDQTTGNITLIAPLEFEKDAQHILRVMARDQYDWNSTATVYVKVGDVPDTPLTTTPQANGNSPPQFTVPYILVIKEDLPIGSVVGTLTATDSDRDVLTFGVSASGSAFNLDDVSKIPGNAKVNITLKSHLDYETVTQFDVGFTVSDGLHKLTKTVTVYVVNVNDNAPLFSKALYIADVLESTPVGSKILTVEATDPDYGPPTYYFYLKDSVSISQNVSHFRINQTSGDITLTASLDFEKDALHILRVMARDQYGWSSTATVNVRVGNLPEKPLNTASPQDCYDVFKTGNTTPGVYTVYPSSDVTKSKTPAPLIVYCEDGWTYLQRRSGYRNHNPVNFDRDWNDYKDGFGDLRGNFWLGNENIHSLTKNKAYKLMVQVEPLNDKKNYVAEYEAFNIDDEANLYTLHVYGYSGNAGDGFGTHNGLPFSTKDKDNDQSFGFCGDIYGGWWYHNCRLADLNGWMEWFTGNKWLFLDRTEMKIKPASVN